MELLKFIKSNSDWYDKLTKEPYCLTISEDENYILFKYNQITSDFSFKLVQEARGIIFRKIDMIPCCVPFWKFFNFSEILAAPIDFAHSRVEEKLDGSIIKYWFDEYWHVSTNGTIDAFKAGAAFSDAVTFGDLAISTLAETVGDINDWEETLNKDYTYMFELCHPLTRIVVRHEKAAIYHIGTRDNITLKELIVDIGVPKPKIYAFNSLESVVLAAQELPGLDLEGYVVVDGYWNRVKIKSPSYVGLHHLINNHVITYKRVLDIVLRGEAEEVISYFEELKPYIDKTVDAYNSFKDKLTQQFLVLKAMSFANRKEYAMEANKSICPAFMYMALDKDWNEKQVEPFLRNMRKENLVKLLGLKDAEKESV